MLLSSVVSNSIQLELCPPSPDPTGPDPTGPDPTGPDPTRPDPTGPDRTRPDPIRPSDDDGYPTGETSEEPQVELGRDADRAQQIVPGDDYRGDSFAEMSTVLNGWIDEMDVESRPCDSFNVTELRQLQALLYLARDVRLDDIYQTNEDNRRIRHSMEQLENDWTELDSSIEGHDEAHPIHAMHRDGHCHEAVMYVFHL